MRTLILIALLTCTAFAADMVHQRVVMKGGEELVGWWCADQGVLYLDNGKRRLIDKPAEQVAKVEPAPTSEKAPARKQFKQLPDLPHVAVTTTTGDAFLGWWDEGEATLWISDSAPSRRFDRDGVASVEARSTPESMPATARRHLTIKSIEQD